MDFEQYAQEIQVWSKSKSKTKKGKICGYCGWDNHGNAKSCVWCKGDKYEYMMQKKEVA